MNTVYFDTPGLLDMRAVTTFGLSVKENENPIGYFGTGLKYAIAILMRAGTDLTISNSSGDTYRFNTIKDTFRSIEYDSIHMTTNLQGYPLPFTTELGKNWKMWMAFRELYCNTKDENGVIHIGNADEREGGRSEWDTWTRVTVHNKELYECYANRSEYFIENATPLMLTSGIEVFERPSEHMFYRRIRVGDLRQEAIMTYNHVRPVELTEDRTVAATWMWERYVTYAIAASDNKNVIHKFVTAPADTFEANVTFDEYTPTVSDEFKEVLKPLCHDLSGRVNKSAQDLYHKHARNTGEGFVFVDPTQVQQRVLDKAVEVCTNLGHKPVVENIHIVKSLGNSVLGTVKREQIYLSIECFDMGTKMVAGTLMEELIHLEEKIHDMTRTLQNFLVNRIMSLYEETKGEPL